MENLCRVASSQAGPESMVRGATNSKHFRNFGNLLYF